MSTETRHEGANHYNSWLSHEEALLQCDGLGQNRPSLHTYSSVQKGASASSATSGLPGGLPAKMPHRVLASATGTEYMRRTVCSRRVDCRSVPSGGSSLFPQRRGSCTRSFLPLPWPLRQPSCPILRPDSRSTDFSKDVRLVDMVLPRGSISTGFPQAKPTSTSAAAPLKTQVPDSRATDSA
ncbi:hypothetical protein CONLIGDRAFT_100673 [Coniochaeta ligniaria NRRL 30616]|uniref:Uncharacterized protein n=1 Tax=Coniochaeta ligniaria NRRL 30616 TaxID=1408157 RepID=A0A1J7J465_9PEZI|nr:hypothetical protein CONLIGDRAFT_100673 [Coniochaeta ligniaria NRRL 30616]